MMITRIPTVIYSDAKYVASGHLYNGSITSGVTDLNLIAIRWTCLYVGSF